MDVLNRNIAIQLNKIGIRQDSDLHYVKVDKISRLCSRTSKGNYLVIKGPKITKILNKKNSKFIYSAFTLSEINDFTKYYNNYFKVYYDFNKDCWKINKNIFKVYFLDYSKRMFIDDFKVIVDKNFDSEVDAKGELLIFLIKSNFIDIEDIK